MARIVYELNTSLDGFVDHESFGPDPVLFEHFIQGTRKLTGSIYGRKLYEIMRYWDDEQPGWTPAEYDYASAWRGMPKWVVSTTLTSVGPNATLISGDVESAVREMKDSLDGEIEVGGTIMARSLFEMGLIDEYRLFVHPVVLGHGTPFFAGIRPNLQLNGVEQIGEEAVRLSYLPADEPEG